MCVRLPAYDVAAYERFYSQEVITAENAAVKLSAIVKEETGAAIPPEQLAAMIRSQWTTVAKLAHKIHGSRG